MYASGPAVANQDLVARVVALLSAPRAGLIIDVDGTISPIVQNPEEARVLPAARAALTDLQQVLAVTAVVSGRAVLDARAHVNVEGLYYIGNHGLEVWGVHGAEVPPEAQPWVPVVADALAALATRVQHAGVLVENKGPSASVHYRQTENPPAARRDLLDALAPILLTSGLRLEEGRMVLNLLPPLGVSKGTAVTWLARTNQLDSVVYVGDDETDAHAFRALAQLRASDGVATLCIGVVGSETPRSVRELADAHVPSAEVVADLLRRVAERLRPGDRMRGKTDTGAE